MRSYGIVLAGLLTLTCGGSAREATPSQQSATTPPPPAVTTPSAAPSSLWQAVSPPNYPCGLGTTPGSCAPSGIEWIGVDVGIARPLVSAVLRPSQASARVVIYLHSDEGLLGRDVVFADALAKQGFVVLAPCWQPPMGRASPSNIGCAGSAPFRSSAKDVASDIGRLAAAARTLPGVKADRLAVIGHSGGASAALLAASTGARVDAVVAMAGAYGTALRNRWGTTVLEQVDGLAVPALVVHGTEDLQAPSTTIQAATDYVTAAREKGKPVEPLYVEGGHHLFPFQQWTDELRAKVVAFLQR